MAYIFRAARDLDALESRGAPVRYADSGAATMPPRRDVATPPLVQ